LQGTKVLLHNGNNTRSSPHPSMVALGCLNGGDKRGDGQGRYSSWLSLRPGTDPATRIVMAWLPQSDIRTYIFLTGLLVLLSRSSNLISSLLPIVVARYFFTLLVPSPSFLPLPSPSGTFCSRLLYVPLPSGSFYMLPTCSG
jgi:hypothetical protein